MAVQSMPKEGPEGDYQIRQEGTFPREADDDDLG